MKLRVLFAALSIFILALSSAKFALAEEVEESEKTKEMKKIEAALAGILFHRNAYGRKTNRSANGG